MVLRDGSYTMARWLKGGKGRSVLAPIPDSMRGSLNARHSVATAKSPAKAGLLKLNGGQRGTRTPGTGIFNPLLYQLSYLTGSRKRGLVYYVLRTLRSSVFANFIDDFLRAAIRTLGGGHGLRVGRRELAHGIGRGYFPHPAQVAPSPKRSSRSSPCKAWRA